MLTKTSQDAIGSVFISELRYIGLARLLEGLGLLEVKALTNFMATGWLFSRLVPSRR